MGSIWLHYDELKGTCPFCGNPSHVGRESRTGRYFWIHDHFIDWDEYVAFHTRNGKTSRAEISKDEAGRIFRLAEGQGLDLTPREGKGPKPVVCVETGRRYSSIAAAARGVGRSNAVIPAAIRRGGTCAGYHWKYV